MGRSRGFSLIELLTVIMIIGILVAISIPLGINYVRIYQATAAGQAVASQMQYARSQAVRRNSSRGMALNFNYPDPLVLQFTTLDENPYRKDDEPPFDPDGVYPGPGAVPKEGNNVSPPHGPVIQLPQSFYFVGRGSFNSLVFQANGSVAGVTIGGRAAVVALDGSEYVVRVKNDLTGLAEEIRVTQSGRITIRHRPKED